MPTLIISSRAYKASLGQIQVLENKSKNDRAKEKLNSLFTSKN